MSNEEVKPVKEDRPHVFKAHGDLKVADHVRTVRHLWCPPGVTFEQATSVKSFVHIAHLLNVEDEIIMRAEDGSFYARVIVRLIKHLDVVVSKLEYVSLKEKIDTTGDSEFEVAYINGRYKWGFKRRGSSDWIEKEIPTEQAALEALADHKKAIAA